MLTIWDIATLLNLVSVSAFKALNFAIPPRSDVSFVSANGMKMAPIGSCIIQFSFTKLLHVFRKRIYVVESAPFQLLLGMCFIYVH